MAAELGDADLEREPGAGGVLVEDDGHTARPVERPALNGFAFSSRGQRQHLGLLVGCEVVVAQEVARHDAAALSSTSGSAVRKSSICALGDDQRRRQPDHVRRSGVDEEPGVAGRRLDGLGRLGR